MLGKKSLSMTIFIKEKVQRLTLKIVEKNNRNKKNKDCFFCFLFNKE